MTIGKTFDSLPSVSNIELSRVNENKKTVEKKSPILRCINTLLTVNAPGKQRRWEVLSDGNVGVKTYNSWFQKIFSRTSLHTVFQAMEKTLEATNPIKYSEIAVDQLKKLKNTIKEKKEKYEKSHCWLYKKIGQLLFGNKKTLDESYSSLDIAIDLKISQISSKNVWYTQKIIAERNIKNLDKTCSSFIRHSDKRSGDLWIDLQTGAIQAFRGKGEKDPVVFSGVKQHIYKNDNSLRDRQGFVIIGQTDEHNPLTNQKNYKMRILKDVELSDSVQKVVDYMDKEFRRRDKGVVDFAYGHGGTDRESNGGGVLKMIA